MVIAFSNGAATYSPDTTKVLARPSLEDHDIESMTNAVRGSSDTGQTSTNDSNSGSLELLTGPRWVRSNDSGEYVLIELEEQQNWVGKDVRHCESVPSAR